MRAVSMRLRLHGGPCRPLRFQEPLSIRKVAGSSSDGHHSSGDQHLSCHIHRPKLVPASSDEYHHFFRKPRKFLGRSEEHTSELQSRGHLVCRLLLEKKNKNTASTSRSSSLSEQ